MKVNNHDNVTLLHNPSLFIIPLKNIFYVKNNQIILYFIVYMIQIPNTKDRNISELTAFKERGMQPSMFSDVLERIALLAVREQDATQQRQGHIVNFLPR